MPNVRGDVTPLDERHARDAVNTIGGLAHDRARFVEWLAPFLPVGFYYKAFHGRGFPALGATHPRDCPGSAGSRATAPRERTPKRYAFCDVLVIGAGPSGLAAALSAADAGARVLLVDENARAGGSGRWSGAATGEIDSLVDRAARDACHRVRCPRTYAAGYYADHWVALVEPTRMTKVRAGAVVFATGVIEQPAVFRNNDLPGVMRARRRSGCCIAMRSRPASAWRSSRRTARATNWRARCARSASPWPPCSTCARDAAATRTGSPACVASRASLPKKRRRQARIGARRCVYTSPPIPRVKRPRKRSPAMRC